MNEDFNNQNGENSNTEEQYNKFKNNPIFKGAKKIGSEVAKALAKSIIDAIMVYLPYILIGLLIILIIIGAYHLLFETRGTQQKYIVKNEANNELINDEEKGYFTSKDLSSENRQVKNFYTYYSKKSFYQLIGDDNKLKQTEGKDKIEDFYKREKQFYLNPNLLWALDEIVFENKMKFPEQFTKPIKYNPDDLTLEQLTDDEGTLIAESNEWVDGEETNKKILGVWDYGIAPIYKYDKEIKKEVIEGEYYQKDVWNSSTGKVETISITPEPFSEEIRREDIWIITKAITFVGEFSWNFEESKKEIAGLENSSSRDPKSNSIKIQYGIHEEYKTEDVYDWVEKTLTSVDANGVSTVTTSKEYEKIGTRQVLVGTYPLYKYRRGAIMEVCPHPVEEFFNNKSDKYFNDYIMNFECYVPENIMNGFDFSERVGLLLDSNLEIGTHAKLTNSNFLGAMAHIETVKKYADMYGVDAKMVIAKMAQESGGKTNIEDGCMQIIGDGHRSVTATNKLTGEKETYHIYSEADRRDPEKAIRWGVMYFAYMMERFEGDSLKALQSYNFDVMIIKEIAPESWDSLDWMNYREVARLQHGRNEGHGETRSINYNCAPHLKRETGKIYGDVCYIENVMRYYAGEDYDDLENHDTQTGWENFKDTFNSFLNSFTSFFAPKYDGEKRTQFTKYGTQRDIEWIFRLSTSMDKNILFSDKDFDTINFWESGFSSMFDSQDMFYSDLINKIPEIESYVPPVKLSNPVIVTKYGTVNNINDGSIYFHDGVDISLPVGTSLFSVYNGIVKEINFDENSTNKMGNYVVIDFNDGNTAIYAHMDRINVSIGQFVKTGELIGTSGQSGDAKFPHLHFSFKVNGNTIDPTYVVQRTELFVAKSNIIDIAMAQLGRPYVWGAEGPEDWDKDGEVSSGFDCSGLIGYVYYKAGINLGRNTAEGMFYDKRLVSVDPNDIKPEDIVFFNTTSTLAHVGMYVGNGKIIHASSSKGKVVVVNYNDYWKQITHGIKRVPRLN